MQKFEKLLLKLKDYPSRLRHKLIIFIKIGCAKWCGSPLSSSRNSASNSSLVGLAAFGVASFGSLVANESPCSMLARTLCPRKAAWILVAAASAKWCGSVICGVPIVGFCWWIRNRSHHQQADCQLHKREMKNQKHLMSINRKQCNCSVCDLIKLRRNASDLFRCQLVWCYCFRKLRIPQLRNNFSTSTDCFV